LGVLRTIENFGENRDRAKPIPLFREISRFFEKLLIHVALLCISVSQKMSIVLLLKITVVTPKKNKLWRRINPKTESKKDEQTLSKVKLNISSTVSQ